MDHITLVNNGDNSICIKGRMVNLRTLGGTPLVHVDIDHSTTNIELDLTEWTIVND